MPLVRHRTTTILTAAFALTALGAVPAAAQVVTLYPFTGNTVTPTSVAAGMTASNLTQSGVLNLFTITNQRLQIEAAPNANNDQAAFSNNSYFQVTLTPAAGFRLSFSQIRFDMRKTSGANRNFFIRSSADNYATNLLNSWSGGNDGGDGVLSGNDIPNSTTLRAYTANASVAALQNLSTAVTFRFYISSPSTGNPLEIDNIEFRGANGSIIPEPSSLALVGGGLVGLAGVLARRRRAA